MSPQMLKSTKKLAPVLSVPVLLTGLGLAMQAAIGNSQALSSEKPAALFQNSLTKGHCDGPASACNCTESGEIRHDAGATATDSITLSELITRARQNKKINSTVDGVRILAAIIDCEAEDPSIVKLDAYSVATAKLQEKLERLAFEDYTFLWEHFLAALVEIQQCATISAEQQGQQPHEQGKKKNRAQRILDRILRKTKQKKSEKKGDKTDEPTDSMKKQEQEGKEKMIQQFLININDIPRPKLEEFLQKMKQRICKLVPNQGCLEDVQLISILETQFYYCAIAAMIKLYILGAKGLEHLSCSPVNGSTRECGRDQAQAQDSNELDKQGATNYGKEENSQELGVPMAVQLVLEYDLDLKDLKLKLLGLLTHSAIHECEIVALGSDGTLGSAQATIASAYMGTADDIALKIQRVLSKLME